MKLRMRADILNVFNWDNFDSYSVNFDDGTASGVNQYITRTFKLSLGLDW